MKKITLKCLDMDTKEVFEIDSDHFPELLECESDEEIAEFGCFIFSESTPDFLSRSLIFRIEVEK